MPLLVRGPGVPPEHEDDRGRRDVEDAEPPAQARREVEERRLALACLPRPDHRQQVGRDPPDVVVGEALAEAVEADLPPLAQHVAPRLDFGIVVDFWFCLAALGIVKTAAWLRQRPGAKTQ